MDDSSRDSRLRLLLEEVELPLSAYESAKRRYEDLGAWFDRAECRVGENEPHIFVQGSFALGTAIRPVKEGQEYDLDLGCVLRRGVDRGSHSQADLKRLVGEELKAYREYRRIQDELEPKNRCWRLNYKDVLPFHMDVVPAIPAETGWRTSLGLLLERNGVVRGLASDIAATAIWITDRRKMNFLRIDLDWLSSNPQGYIKWFVSSMTRENGLLLDRAQVDDVPLYARRTPLQQVIQLLKAHRDSMFEQSPDCKPISVIITTIAANAYVPGQSLGATFEAVLEALEAFRRSNSDVVPNPVNPEENFADRWKSAEGRRLRLKENFHAWILGVRSDAEHFLNQRDARRAVEHARTGWKVRLDERTVASAAGMTGSSVIAPRRIHIESAPRPWTSRDRWK